MALAAAITGTIGLAMAAAALLFTRWLAAQFLTLKPERRRPLSERPEDYGVTGEDVQVTTDDGLILRGWYMPGRNGATVMAQHGTPGGRQDVLFEAAFLNKHGYNVLLGSFRAHDDSDGVDVSFGYHEMKDAAAWHAFLLGRAEVDPARIGIFGESMGGVVAIRYAVEQPQIAAVATASVPVRMDDAAEHMMRCEFPGPGWIVRPLARLFVFWSERLAGCSADDVTVLPVVADLSPRPLLVIHGGSDNRVPVEDGHKLVEAAGEPRELWFVPEARHVDFERFRPAEYRRRVLRFFDRYLLGQDYKGI
jgi:fermentation-respiration switch protein FrsA (DUF1100 family)